MSVSKDIPWLHDLKAEAVKSFAVMNKRNIVFFLGYSLTKKGDDLSQDEWDTD